MKVNNIISCEICGGIDDADSSNNKIKKYIVEPFNFRTGEEIIVFYIHDKCAYDIIRKPRESHCKLEILEKVYEVSSMLPLVRKERLIQKLTNIGL